MWYMVYCDNRIIYDTIHLQLTVLTNQTYQMKQQEVNIIIKHSHDLFSIVIKYVFTSTCTIR